MRLCECDLPSSRVLIDKATVSMEATMLVTVCDTQGAWYAPGEQHWVRWQGPWQAIPELAEANACLKWRWWRGLLQWRSRCPCSVRYFVGGETAVAWWLG